jgi:hypothetical protein
MVNYVRRTEPRLNQAFIEAALAEALRLSWAP